MFRKLCVIFKKFVDVEEYLFVNQVAIHCNKVAFSARIVAQRQFRTLLPLTTKDR